MYNFEDLDLVILMNTLIEYSSNYNETTESLWFYSKNEDTSFNDGIASNNDIKSFEYETRLLRNTEADRAKKILRNATIDVSLKHWSNFWRSLEMPLINWKIELKLK